MVIADGQRADPDHVTPRGEGGREEGRDGEPPDDGRPVTVGELDAGHDDEHGESGAESGASLRRQRCPTNAHA